MPDVRNHRRTMRAVIQRVSGASVTIAEEVRSATIRGLIVHINDAPEDIEWPVSQLVRPRIFPATVDEYRLSNSAINRGTTHFLKAGVMELTQSCSSGPLLPVGSRCRRRE